MLKIVRFAMKKLDRISSKDGLNFVEIFQLDDRSIVLRRFAKKFDPEEDVFYVIEVLPHPSSRFAELQAAVDEAQRMIEAK